MHLDLLRDVGQPSAVLTLTRRVTDLTNRREMLAESDETGW